MEEMFFEIRDTTDYIRLEPIHLIEYDSDLAWDKNWVKTKIIVKAGSFSGEYFAEFMTIDFEKLKHDLRRIYDNLNGFVDFIDLESHLELKISGDGIGHFNVRGRASEDAGIINALSFELSFDQTEINEMINQLERITKSFPIVGNLNIPNS
jgi:hypothetical protein